VQSQLPCWKKPTPLGRNSDYTPSARKLRLVNWRCLMKIQLQPEFTVAVAPSPWTHNRLPASEWKEANGRTAARPRRRLGWCLPVRLEIIACAAGAAGDWVWPGAGRRLRPSRNLRAPWRSCGKPVSTVKVANRNASCRADRSNWQSPLSQCGWLFLDLPEVAFPREVRQQPALCFASSIRCPVPLRRAKLVVISAADAPCSALKRRRPGHLPTFQLQPPPAPSPAPAARARHTALHGQTIFVLRDGYRQAELQRLLFCKVLWQRSSRRPPM